MNNYRKRIRLQGFDYSRPGNYFITINVQQGLLLFGEIRDSKVVLSESGRMIEKWLLKIPEKYQVWSCPHYVIMPNHVHAVLSKKGNCRGEPVCSPRLYAGKTPLPQNSHTTLSDVVQWFKTLTTNEYIRGVKAFNWYAFHGKLWQRSFHDHIVSDGDELLRIIQYIRENPAKWSRTDPFNWY